ncbi:hypothetical protein [Bradyrhizobium sp.]|nr:hypothetical protein [Bradyrhizobium sp.]
MVHTCPNWLKQATDKDFAMTIRPDLNGRVAPLGRMGQAHEVAQAVLMVLGNDYMTGQTIMLNGGMAFV